MLPNCDWFHYTALLMLCVPTSEKALIEWVLDFILTKLLVCISSVSFVFFMYPSSYEMMVLVCALVYLYEASWTVENVWKFSNSYSFYENVVDFSINFSIYLFSVVRTNTEKFFSPLRWIVVMKFQGESCVHYFFNFFGHLQ